MNYYIFGAQHNVWPKKKKKEKKALKNVSPHYCYFYLKEREREHLIFRTLKAALEWIFDK